MPTTTPNLGLKKPLGNEAVSRSAYNENLDILDVNAAKAASLTAHLADYVRQPGYAVATGAANTYAVTLNPAPTAYVEGMAVSVKINVDNTGASAINVNGLGAKAIKKPNGSDVSASNLKAGSIYALRYTAPNFFLQGEGGGGTAQSGDVLIGKTFTNDTGEQTGTMPNKVGSTTIITPGTADQVIPKGFYGGAAGDGKVVGDADLVSAKIKSGVNIFGVAGTVVEATGDANAADVLSGKTYSKAGQAGITGTMPNRGAVNVTPSWSDQTIQAGYHNGSGKVTALVVAAGDNPAYTDPSVVSTDSTSYTKKKEATMKRSGSIRVRFTLYNNSSTAGNAYGQIYINDVAVGKERQNNSSSPQVFEEDFNASVNDKVQLYLKHTVASTGYPTYARDFEIRTAFDFVIAI